MAIRRACSHRVVLRHGSFDMKRKQAILESISVSPRRWHSSHLADGRIHSLEICMVRAWMQWSSSHKRRLWLRDGRKSGVGSFKKSPTSVDVGAKSGDFAFQISKELLCLA